jgi:CheY-like chemotaxis protein
MEIEDILRSHGYTSIDFAVSAAEAVAAAASRCPDLITSDVQLNPGSGLDAVEEICRASAVPVIFITCNTADVRARLPQYPALRKPFRAASLEAALTQAAAVNG